MSASDNPFLDGTRINWRRLGITVFGAGALAFAQGFASSVLSLANIPVAFLAWVGAYVDVLVGYVLGVPVVRAAWASAAEFVRSTGPAGYLVALVIVLATLYGLAEVIRRVR